MSNHELQNALSYVLRMRLDASANPEGLLATAELELAQWVASNIHGLDAPSVEMLEMIRSVVAEERARLAKPPH